VNNQAVPNARALSLDEMTRAIVSAGAGLGWNMNMNMNVNVNMNVNMNMNVTRSRQHQRHSEPARSHRDRGHHL